jgi:hypothetical protein
VISVGRRGYHLTGQQRVTFLALFDPQAES